MDAETEQTHSPTLSPDDSFIVIQVGDRRFCTLTATLTDESSYFASRLSSLWSKPTSSSGVTLFVDADPDLFQHILNYLRRGIYPFFWTRATGFDYPRYAAILEEARFFGICNLQMWIEQHEYRKLVSVTNTLKMFNDMEECQGDASFTKQKAETERVYLSNWSERYECPQGLASHRGHRCNLTCDQLLEDYIRKWKADVLAIETTWEFHQEELIAREDVEEAQDANSEIGSKFREILLSDPKSYSQK